MKKNKTRIGIVLVAMLLALSMFPFTQAIYTEADAVAFHNQLFNSMSLWEQIQWMNTHGLLTFTAEGQARKCDVSQRFGDLGQAEINPNALCKAVGSDSSLVDVYDVVNLNVACTSNSQCTSYGGFCDLKQGHVYYGKCIRSNFKYESRGEYYEPGNGVGPAWCGLLNIIPRVRIWHDRIVSVSSTEAYEVYCCPKTPCVPAGESCLWETDSYFKGACGVFQECLRAEVPGQGVENEEYTFCKTGGCTTGQIVSRNCAQDEKSVYKCYYKTSSCDVTCQKETTCNEGYKCMVTGTGQAECKKTSENVCEEDTDCDSEEECNNGQCEAINQPQGDEMTCCKYTCGLLKCYTATTQDNCILKKDGESLSTSQWGNHPECANIQQNNNLEWCSLTQWASQGWFNKTDKCTDGLYTIILGGFGFVFVIILFKKIAGG